MALAIFRKKIKAKKIKKNGIHLHANTRQLSSDIYCNASASAFFAAASFSFSNN